MESSDQKSKQIKKDDSNAISFSTNIVKVLTSFNLWMLQNNYSRNSCLVYRHQVKKLFVGPNPKVPLCNVKNPKLSSHRIYKFLTGKCIVSRSAVKLFLKYLRVEKNKRLEIEDYPKLKKSEKKIVEVLSDEEITKIISNLPIQVKKLEKKPSVEYKFFTGFLYMLGLRISESFRLRVADINFEEWKKNKEDYGFLKVSNTKGKKERLVPIPPLYMVDIYNYVKKTNLRKKQYEYRKKDKRDGIENDEEYKNIKGKVDQDAFLFDFNTQYYLDRIKRKAKRKKVGFPLGLLGKEYESFLLEYSWFKFIHKESAFFQKLFRKTSLKILGKPSHPHVLRASRATALLDIGVPIIEVRDFLGHSSISVTELYLKTGVEKLSSSMKKFGI